MAHTKKSLNHILIYLTIAFGFSWTLWGSQALFVNNVITHPIIELFASLYTYGAWGPLVAAIFIAIKSRGIQGIEGMFTQTFNLNFAKNWLIPTFLLFPLIIGLPLLILSVLGQPIPELVNLTAPFILPIVFFVILLNAGPLQEEYGWRGTLQQELQNRFGVLQSSLITGLIWGIWHLPLFFIPDQGFYYNKPIWGLLLSTTLISVIFGWIYNNTNRNLLLMLILHTTYNFSHYIFPTLESDPAGLLYFVLLILTVRAIIRSDSFKSSTR